ncbi:MAG TPA: tRNA (adenosine(37)-N6)-threonylcarbamoyltransferase complex ATPase subunit type 1 TsaE [Vicinamibacterales bacterium]
MSEVRTVVTLSERETEELGRSTAERLGPGARLHLCGDLGAGKTAFVRGLADGLGIDPDEVSSPTFTLIQEYRGRLPLLHVDLYRIAPAEVHDLGLEALAADGVLAIEWADRLPEPDPGAIRIVFEHVSEHGRRITIQDPAGLRT